MMAGLPWKATLGGKSAFDYDIGEPHRQQPPLPEIIMTTSRRDFLKQASVTTLLTAVATDSDCRSHVAAAEPAAGGALPIIDTHQHLWDLSRFQPPWLQGAPPILSRSYVTQDYLEATAGLNVVKAVYMEVDVAPEQQRAEAEHVIGLSQSAEHPTVGAVISGRPNLTTFAAYIKGFEGNRYIKGVRQVLHVPSAPRGLCLEKRFVASMRLLGELGMSYDLCMRPSELIDGAELAKLCPDTRFVVDHCGNADPLAFQAAPSAKPAHNVEQWRSEIGRLAACPNVICKISGIVARAPQGDWDASLLAPIINFCLDEFGPDRVVFGGDWPVCLLGASYHRWVETLREVISSRSTVDQRKLLHDNAEQFYRLA